MDSFTQTFSNGIPASSFAIMFGGDAGKARALAIGTTLNRALEISKSLNADSTRTKAEKAIHQQKLFDDLNGKVSKELSALTDELNMAQGNWAREDDSLFHSTSTDNFNIAAWLSLQPESKRAELACSDPRFTKAVSNIPTAVSGLDSATLAQVQNRYREEHAPEHLATGQSLAKDVSAIPQLASSIDKTLTYFKGQIDTASLEDRVSEIDLKL